MVQDLENVCIPDLQECVKFGKEEVFTDSSDRVCVWAHGMWLLEDKDGGLHSCLERAYG